MRWKTAGLWVLAIVGTLGCPHAFGRGGTIDKAAQKDVEGFFDPWECTPDERKIYCEKDPEDEECKRICG